MKTNQLFRSVCVALAAWLSICWGPLNAHAAMVATEAVVHAPADVGAAAERARLNAILAREDVRQEMTNLGVDPNEAAMRVAAMSDAEVKRLVGTLGEQPAGGQVIAVLLIILLVVAIIYLGRRV